MTDSLDEGWVTSVTTIIAPCISASQ